MTTPPQVPAALCGLFPGARADLAGNRYQATEEFEAGVWQFKYRTNHGVQHITMSCHDMALLLDSPLALCHAACWLATRLGMDPGVTAPLWSFADGVWLLQTEAVTAVFHSGTYLIDDPDTIGRYVEDLPMSKNKYVAALAAACVAVGGAS